MTAPAKKTPAKKTARKRSAAVAARTEVRKEGTGKVYDVPFRGAIFKIPLDRIGNGKVYFRQRALEQFGGPEEFCALLFDILGPTDSARWINLMGPGDEIFTEAGKFMTAINKAGNVPNS